jgi:hypothetical protein
MRVEGPHLSTCIDNALQHGAAGMALLKQGNLLLNFANKLQEAASVRDLNAAIIARLTGVPCSPATVETDSDFRNPNVPVNGAGGRS